VSNVKDLTAWRVSIRTDAIEPTGQMRVYAPEMADQQPLLYRRALVLFLPEGNSFEDFTKTTGGAV
jgi:hypothetical protein